MESHYGVIDRKINKSILLMWNIKKKKKNSYET